MELIHETDRLYLKILDASWAPSVCSFYQKNKVSFEAVEPPRIPNFYTVSFHKLNLIQEYNEFMHGHYLRLYLFEKSNPKKIIGSICYNSFRTGCFQSCTLGYKTDVDARNLGYMSEALSYSIHHIISAEYGLHRIEAMVLPDNHVSIHLLEKSGFFLEGCARDYAKLNGVWKDHFRYSMLLYQ